MLISNVLTQLRKTLKNTVFLVLAVTGRPDFIDVEIDWSWLFAWFLIPQYRYSLLLEVVLFAY